MATCDTKLGVGWGVVLFDKRQRCPHLPTVCLFRALRLKPTASEDRGDAVSGQLRPQWGERSGESLHIVSDV